MNAVDAPEYEGVYSKKSNRGIQYFMKINDFSADNYEWRSKEDVQSNKDIELMIDEFEDQLKLIKDLNKKMGVHFEQRLYSKKLKPKQVCSQFDLWEKEKYTTICEIEWENSETSLVLAKEVKALRPDLLINYYDRIMKHK